jgi:hypothetical protein
MADQPICAGERADHQRHEPDPPASRGRAVVPQDILVHRGHRQSLLVLAQIALDSIINIDPESRL